MGYGRIFVVYEDGIQEAERSVEAWDRLRPEVGEGVLKVCFDRTLSLEGERSERRRRSGDTDVGCQEPGSTLTS